jgi:hypothetical protein
MPSQSFVLPGTLQIVVTDPNVSDDIYVRWIGEYPDYSPNSRLLKNDIIPKSVDGTPLRGVSEMPDLGCLQLARLPQHAITALVTDRPFLTTAEVPADDPEQLEKLLTSTRVNAGRLEAHWVLNVDCR